MWARLSRAAFAAILGMSIGVLLALYALGFLIAVAGIIMVLGEQVRREVATFETLFCATAALIIAVVVREMLIWLLGRADNDKRQFLKRVRTGLVVGAILLATVCAFQFIFFGSRLHEYKDAPFFYYFMLTCGIAGALVCGLLWLIESPKPRDGATTIWRFFRWYAYSITLGLALAVLMWLSYCLLSPTGRWIGLALLQGERFSHGMPVSYWKHQLRNEEQRKKRGAVWVSKEQEAEWEAHWALQDCGEEPKPKQSPRSRSDQFFDKKVKAALALPAERRDAALLALIKSADRSDSLEHVGVVSDAIAAMASSDPPRVDALIKVLKSKDLFTTDHAADALAQIGPEASRAVPALVELWWTSSGRSLETVADAIEEIEPGALQRARIHRYLTRSAIAGALLALPVLGCLWLISRTRRTRKSREARRRPPPNPFRPAAASDVPEPAKANRTDDDIVEDGGSI